MSESRRPAGIWRFGVFEADLDAGELRKNGMKVHLQGQPFHVLAVLLLHSGRLVRREQLRREVWPEDTFVEFDHALNTAVKKVRFALGDDAMAPRYVETISRRGYRLIGTVQPPADLTRDGRIEVVPRVNAGNPSSAWKLAGKVLVTIAISALIAFQLAHRLRAAQNHGAKRVVLAILPFENWSDDSRQAFLGERIAQELITQLGRTDPARLQVASRTMVQQYRHTSKTVVQVGSELRADYLMEGSLRNNGRHVRVSAELVRVSDQARVWGDEFDREDDDLLALESDVAKSISAKVRAAVLAGAAE
ncbi:MAG TPA: winged helix-turn-helix domain-containing protein [Terriglobales bacterium]|nr:winged helix-turn-helix domain-containing protein [Terriglobales bacterium]